MRTPALFIRRSDTRAANCKAAFKSLQHTLKHTTAGVDNSGYTPKGWRQTVKRILAHLQ